MQGLYGPMRTDLSFTLFLSDPADDDGGELVVTDPLAERFVKQPVGEVVTQSDFRG
jgi:PKHD-type hydroxylase